MVFRVKQVSAMVWKVLKALIVSMAAILYRPLPENILFLLTSLMIMLSGKIRHLPHGLQGQRSQTSGLESSTCTYSVTGGHFVSAITRKHTFSSNIINNNAIWKNKTSTPWFLGSRKPMQWVGKLYRHL